MDFEECLRRGSLKPAEPADDLVEKELAGAEFDFKTAQESFEEGNVKWAAVQCYYAVFHAAKALVLSKGFAEKGHRCLFIAFEELFVKPGLFEKRFLDLYDDLMLQRESADYDLSFIPKEHFAPFLEETREFLALAKKTLKKKK